jgi:hypothetical protein
MKAMRKKAAPADDDSKTQRKLIFDLPIRPPLHAYQLGRQHDKPSLAQRNYGLGSAAALATTPAVFGCIAEETSTAGLATPHAPKVAACAPNPTLIPIARQIAAMQ